MFIIPPLFDTLLQYTYNELILLFIIVFTADSVSMTVCIEVYLISRRTGTHSDMIDNLNNVR